MHRLTFLVVALALATTQPACTMHRVAAPRAPDASMPELEELPPSGGGLARVVIGTDVPARVHRANHRDVLCAETPCVVTLPYGDYELVFEGTQDGERASHAKLAVHRETVVLNHTLGRVHTPAGQTVASVLAVLGAAVVGVALGIAAEDRTRATPASETTVAPKVAGAGFGVMVLGGLIGLASPGTRQEGASTQWSPRGTTAGASVGLRF